MSIPFAFTTLDEPLPVVGVVGLALLAAPLLARARGTDFEVVKGPDMTVLLGPAASLPFLDGVIYVAENPAEPALLHPPMIAPDVDPSLVLAALERAFSLTRPLICLPRQGLVVSVAQPRRSKAP